MARFPLTLDVRQVRRGLKRLEKEAPQVVATTLRKAMTNIARRFTGQVTKQRLTGGPSVEKLGVRTGNLRRSLGFSVEGRRLDDLVAFMGFGPPAHPWSGGAEKYGPIHETGGEITPKNSQYLAIPIADNLTGAGVARVRSPRDLGAAVFIPWVGDTFLVFDSGRLMFKLQRSVTIPARLNFANDWAQFRSVALDLLLQSLREALARVRLKGDR